MSRRIAFVAYESQWFPSGGIKAVMDWLPSAVRDEIKLPTIVITPLHRQSAKLADLKRDSVAVASDTAIRLTKYAVSEGCEWYFVESAMPSAADPPYFNGARHPYDLVHADQLLRDALFFGEAVPHAIHAIDPKADWTLLLQDWEAATTALAFGDGAAPRMHLTLHNTYDSPPNKTKPGPTVLYRAFEKVRLPILTVSQQFARDMTDDLLQSTVMAPHLQEFLKAHPVCGIDNGPFKKLSIPRDCLDAASNGSYDALQAWKHERRQNAYAALDGHVPSDERSLWGDPRRFRRDDAPWFVMAGRDDPRQKGYDVAVAAVREYLAAVHGTRHCAQFLFFPIPGDEGTAGLSFLWDLANDYPEDVIAFPFMWKEGFGAALQGAAFGMMPSLYEPFGMANEFYLDGCVGIGRATGGNLQQIVPLRTSRAFSGAVKQRADSLRSSDAPPTGILFREPDGIPTARADWTLINGAGYSKDGGSPSRVEQRLSTRLFRATVAEMRIAIEEGVRIMKFEPAAYSQMLTAGVMHIQRSFSWKKAAEEYGRQIA